VNFQVTVLKILVSYPDGFAAMDDLKRDMAILATSGRDWSERTRRLGARIPGLDIFSQGMIERLQGGWRITDRGRAALELMEGRQAAASRDEASAAPDQAISPERHFTPEQVERQRGGRRRRLAARKRARAGAS
jgi:hypothetical protein